MKGLNMHTVTPTTTTVKPIAISDAFRAGASDAQSGYPFAPESYFVRRTDKVQYAIGFEMVRGATEITRQFTASVNWN
jgi:hypothetical protein